MIEAGQSRSCVAEPSPDDSARSSSGDAKEHRDTRFGCVVIGRNEGERLKRCIKSINGTRDIVYVDSGSTDGSVAWARGEGIEVVELDTSVPFTAARARNAGFGRLREMVPDLAHVQFVDGDCEVAAGWPGTATAFLDSRHDTGMVAGRLRERHPERTIYNWLCDQEWDMPAGEVRACGGIVMLRADALDAVGGYRDDVIAGEEPELCIRLRSAGWRIWRLDVDMARHDAAMTRFGQWWRRALRCGYSFAQGAYLYGAPPERHFVWESRRAWLWGALLPLVCLIASVTLAPWGWVAWLIYPLQVLRQTGRNDGPLRKRATLALFQILARFPEALGQIRFMHDRLLGRQARIIEYK